MDKVSVILVIILSFPEKTENESIKKKQKTKKEQAF